MSKLLALFLGGISLWGLEFHSYEEALTLQKNSGKMIMIDVVKTGCHYCENMDAKVLQDKVMSQYLEKKIIAVRLYLDKDKLLLGMKVDFTPTFYFLDTKQNIIKKVPGSWNIKDFKSIIEGIK